MTGKTEWEPARAPDPDEEAEAAARVEAEGAWLNFGSFDMGRVISCILVRSRVNPRTRRDLRRCGGGGLAATAAAPPQHPPALGLAALLKVCAPPRTGASRARTLTLTYLLTDGLTRVRARASRRPVTGLLNWRGHALGSSLR